MRSHGEGSFNLCVLLHSKRASQVKGCVTPMRLPSEYRILYAEISMSPKQTELHHTEISASH